MGLGTDLIQKVKTTANGFVDSVTQGVGSATEFVRENPVTSAATAAGTALAGLTVVQISKKRKSTKSKSSGKSKTKASKKRSTKRKPKRKTAKRKSKQKQPYTAGKRKDTSRRRIRYTKNNQPYVIMANGRARFIKKSSVSRSRKRKGGRY